jgi:hypothetical protein
MKNYGKWFYLAGMLVAVVAGLFSFQATWLSLIVLLLAILAGIFYIESDDLVNGGIRFLVFVTVQSAFGAIPTVGSYLSTIFGAVAAFLAPVFLTALVVYFVKKLFMSKKEK